MSASLVGSEMCIRDSSSPWTPSCSAAVVSPGSAPRRAALATPLASSCSSGYGPQCSLVPRCSYEAVNRVQRYGC
eukprot:1690353-Alexandrium_andersonii.AAC.1